jgi:hypothetical protein
MNENDETMLHTSTTDGGGPPESGNVWWTRTLHVLRWLYCLLKILWLCGAAVATLFAMAACFIWNAQGQDVLRMLSDSAGVPHRTAVEIFLGAVLCWSLATWYTSRLLLSQKLPGFRLLAEPSGPLREWTPRILGALPPAIIAAAFAELDTPQRPLAALFSLATVLLFLFYWGRRRIIPGALSPQAQLTTVPWSTRIILIVALVLTFVLLGMFVVHPVAPARFLGAASILVLAATSVLLFVSIVLTYLPLARGYPSLVLLVFLWAVLCSPFNDNHYVHVVPVPKAALTKPAAPDGDDAPLQQTFQDWLVQAQKEASAKPGEAAPAAGRPYPIFIVAAAGGGIRAAYWSAAVLAHAVEHVGSADVWRRHLFAMSGVSGGSLGVSVHMAELQRGLDAEHYLQPAERMLGQDHIAPVLAAMLFPDMVQRFLVVPIPAFDRARALESSWELSARSSLGTRAFSRPFLDLWKDQQRVLPSLLLNSVRVETGQRVLVSNLPISADFVDAVDLLRPTPASLRKPLTGITLAAAVHLSARFAYVSPAARVEDSGGHLWGRLVDGGYFESSGAVTARDLIRGICPDWNRPEESDEEPAPKSATPAVCNSKLPASLGRIVPVVLLIKNDPEAASLCDTYAQTGGAGPSFFTEIKPPVEALLATRDARARVAQRAIVRLIEGHDRPAGDCEEGCVLELSLAPRAGTEAARAARRGQYNDPPLGWSLSEESRADMDRRFGDSDIQNQLECIANLANGKACTSAQRCSRHEAFARSIERVARSEPAPRHTEHP